MEDKIYKPYYKSHIKDVDEKGIVKVAVNCFGNVDDDEDISMEGSYKKTIQEFFNRVKWFYNHNRSQLLGVPLEAKEVYPYLEVVAKFNMKKELSRDVYEDYKLYAEHNRTLEHSVGVSAIKYERDNETGIRKVFEWKWWEFSTLSSWGANENTPLLDIKSLTNNQDIIEGIKLLSDAIKGKYSDNKLKKIENHLNNIKSLITGEPEKPLPVNYEPIFELINKSKLFNP
jgi:hypothetical protein